MKKLIRQTIVPIVLSFITFNFVLAQSDTTSIIWKEGYLDIHHINTGRGVCTFMVLPDGTTIMVDAGDLDDTPFETGGKSWPLKITKPYPNRSKNSGEWIVDYVLQVFPKIKKIDYALITHFHGDHMGMIKKDSKASKNGNYKLTGLTQVGDIIPIKTIIDRNYPDYNFPLDLKKFYKEDNSIFLNYLSFIDAQSKTGLQAASLQVGVTNQIVLKNAPTTYPNFKVTGVKANGTIWKGSDSGTFEYFTADSILDAKKKFSENPLSLAIKLSYGKFDYFTGGDNTGLQGYGLPTWFDVETPMAKAVGKVEVTTLNHHGNRDGTNENFLSNLQPKVVVEQTWCSDHPGQEVMHRLLSNHIYKGEKNIFATNIQEVTKHTLGFWFTQGYKSMFGHIVIRVLPGGNSYYVLIAETINGKVQITKSFGPYISQ